MRIYGKSTWITGCISLASFIAALVLHFTSPGAHAEFGCNVSLAVFGSALLAAITSVITYRYEKQRIMEEFSKNTKALLHYLKKYDALWDDERKMEFFLTFDEMDFNPWDGYLRDIGFMWDPFRRKRKYIYEKIYFPLITFIQKVSENERHFRYHKEAIESSTAGLRDSETMKNFITEIETLFIEVKEFRTADPGGIDFVWKDISNKLVHSVLTELNGHYYDLMYGRKKDKDNG